MKRLMFSLIFCFVLNFSFGQPQSIINKIAYTNFQKVDSQLNIIYQKVLKINSSDTVLYKKLIISESIWEEFRDAEMDVKFAHRMEPGYYGSMYRELWFTYKRELTEERIKQLKVWL